METAFKRLVNLVPRRGRIIAFGGRALEKDVPAKYLNSPETPLFHKGAILYNHHNARKAAHESVGPGAGALTIDVADTCIRLIGDLRVAPVHGHRIRRCGVCRHTNLQHRDR